MKRTSLFSVILLGLLSAQAGQATSIYTAGPGLAMAIPDNGYTGTQASMGCSTINVASEPGLDIISGPVTVSIAMSHTFVGDLTIKLFGPTPAQSFTLVSRPGVVETADDGTDTAGFGENSNLAIANPLTYAMAAADESEQMGKVPSDHATGDIICVFAGSPCSYNPNAGASVLSADFAALNGTSKVGAWALCIGDSASADTGTLDGWTLNFGTVTPVELTGISVE